MVSFRELDGRPKGARRENSERSLPPPAPEFIFDFEHHLLSSVSDHYRSSSKYVNDQAAMMIYRTIYRMTQEYWYNKVCPIRALVGNISYPNYGVEDKDQYPGWRFDQDYFTKIVRERFLSFRPKIDEEIKKVKNLKFPIGTKWLSRGVQEKHFNPTFFNWILHNLEAEKQHQGLRIKKRNYPQFELRKSIMTKYGVILYTNAYVTVGDSEHYATLYFVMNEHFDWSNINCWKFKVNPDGMDHMSFAEKEQDETMLAILTTHTLEKKSQKPKKQKEGEDV